MRQKLPSRRFASDFCINQLVDLVGPNARPKTRGLVTWALWLDPLPLQSRPALDGGFATADLRMAESLLRELL